MTDSKAKAGILHSRIVVIGAGDAGAAVTRYLKEFPSVNMADVKIIDSKRTYHYQGAQVLYAFEMEPSSFGVRDELEAFPHYKDVQRVFSDVVSIDASENTLTCADGTKHSYDALIIAAGVILRPDLVKGLKEALENPDCPVASVYMLESARKYRKLVKSFQGGNAIFTQPATPVKCGGAPQKVAYLSCSKWNQSKKPDAYKAEFCTGTAGIFINPHFWETLHQTMDSYNCKVSLKTNLIEIIKDEKKAIFHSSETGDTVVKQFDLLHVTPPQTAPDFIRISGLGMPNGFVEVDHQTLQHKKHKNIFALGDCADLPTSKTASTVSETGFVVAQNVLSYLNKTPIEAQYNGYTACSLLIGGNKAVLAEFGYENKLMPTIALRPKKPSYFMGFVVGVMIPRMYPTLAAPKIRRIRNAFLKLRRSLGAIIPK